MKWRLAPLLLAIATPCSGCEDPTIWSAQTRSADGRWLVQAHSVRHSGPGANGVETIVELKDQEGLRRSTRILGFRNDGAAMDLQMSFVTPSHLDVAYKDAPEVLYFQVVKTSGIEITTRDIRSGSSAAREHD